MGEYVHQIGDAERVRIQRFVHGVAVGTAGFVMLVVVAVATVPHWIKLISHESERRFVEPYVTLARDHVLTEPDPVLQAYVARLGLQLARQMEIPPDLDLEFRVVEGATVNAFTTMGGYIFVFEGLLAALDNENSLAMVLAHEIAHAGYRDPLSSAGRGILLQVLIATLAGGGGVDPAAATELGTLLMLNAYSREQEAAADRRALEALDQHYGHVGGAAQLFERLIREYGDAEVPEILASHPNLDDRIANLRRIAEESGWRRLATAPYPPEVRRALSRP